MAENKISYQDKDDRELGKSFAKEFGAVIRNDVVNYPKVDQWRQSRPVIDVEKCVGCAGCVAVCPEAAIEMVTVGKKKKAQVDYAFCKGEGICAAACPVGAIKMEKEKK